jgi:hypothetical protein
MSFIYEEKPSSLPRVDIVWRTAGDHPEASSHEDARFTSSLIAEFEV